MGRVEQQARALLLQRVARMQRLITTEAPDFLLASEAELIADAGRMLDPEVYGNRVTEQIQAAARQRFGICAIPRCDLDVEPGNDECPTHAAEQRGIDAMAKGRGHD